MIASTCFYALLIWSVTVVSVFSDCPPGKKTDDPQGRCCVFPFEYVGKTFNNCTDYNWRHNFWCSLTAVYSGESARCVGPCINNNPCKNGGTCTEAEDDTYSCQCPDGFEGDNCETLTSGDCPPGKKTDDPQGRCCVFPFEYYGGKTFNSCTDFNWPNNFWCSLTAVFSGESARCVGPCAKNPCQNGATCTEAEDDTYSCQCPDGFEGDNLNPCTNNTCLNGATCTVTGDDSYSCQCAEGYHGNSCEKVSCNISACPEGWVLREKSCFLVIDIPTLKWSDARRTCQNLGGDLAIIRSADENTFIFELIKKQKTVTAWGAWLGLYRKAYNEFYWVDDSSLAGQYSAWASGEPSSAAETCTHIYGTGGSPGKWNDLTCEKNQATLQYSPVVLCQKTSN
ncbi:neurocan core protein-like isoform X2 [Oculina patagonica]